MPNRVFKGLFISLSFKGERIHKRGFASLELSLRAVGGNRLKIWIFVYSSYVRLTTSAT